MKIETININKINPAAYNPRVDLKPGDKEYEKLKQSINTFGYVEILVWNCRTGNLVGGHQRLKILLEQGVEDVEVSVVDLDIEKEKALNLALNRIEGSWDQDKLAALLSELKQIPDFDTGLTGFELPEINKILREFEEAQEDGFNEAVDLNAKAITSPGDLIELGAHRILCGDCSNPEDLARLMGDQKAGMVFTDPPYGCSYDSSKRPVGPHGGNGKSKWSKIENDDLPQPEYEQWLRKVLQHSSSHLASGAPVYIWNGSRQFGPMYEILLDEGFHVSCVITWAKESFAPGYSDYHQKTEFCLYGWKENNGAHKFYGPNDETTLWEIKRDARTNAIHPTQKPVALAHRAIRNSSRGGEIVLDMFLGSGTTLIAAEGLKRRCFGMEINPHYVDAIVKRYVQLVGVNNVPMEMLFKYQIRKQEGGGYFL